MQYNRRTLEELGLILYDSSINNNIFRLTASMTHQEKLKPKNYQYQPYDILCFIRERIRYVKYDYTIMNYNS